MKAYSGSGVVVRFISDRCPRWRDCSALRPGCITCRGRNPIIPLIRGWLASRDSVNILGKIKFLARATQPVRSPITIMIMLLRFLQYEVLEVSVDKKNQLDVTFVFFISLLLVAQHASGNHFVALFFNHFYVSSNTVFY